ncbi:hypothetical protein SI65_02944 [Aspergillus cristatus]|uniref:Uncharacterized protein n=1 Tax=Aspergillus cristatus TaxID=573508 RepID=A0A1E3BMG0_ASPCR|nr:hypothetical protein SI65_02944 [Aspergillus cristatus]
MAPKELTPEEWRERLHQNPKRLELPEPLHSKTLSLDAKDKIFAGFLEISQNKTNNESTDKDNEAKEIADLECLERALADTGDGVYAQEIRLLLFKRQSVAEIEQNLRWAQDVIEADIKGRWIVQREVFVGEEFQDLCVELTLFGVDDLGEFGFEVKDKEDKETQLAAYKAELQRLNDEYWQHKQHVWRLEANTPLGPMRRAYEACRQKPDWHLSEWLRRDCAGRGGCCRRKCGCCEKARKTEREWNHGHCTSACRCCIASKGCSSKGKTTVEEDLKAVPFGFVAYETPYDERMFCEYILGMG